MEAVDLIKKVRRIEIKTRGLTGIFLPVSTIVLSREGELPSAK